jgi:hypothetical protein
MTRYSLDLARFLYKQIRFSSNAFGPGDRTAGILDHIRKEIAEVERATTDGDKMREFVDIVILSLDAMWRLGFSPEEIVAAIQIKHNANMNRVWPDWRTVPHDKAIEHDRSQE